MESKIVKGVVISGNLNGVIENFVSKLKLKYSNDDSNWYCR